MRETSSARIPNYLAAGDLRNLRRLMLLNNVRLGQEVQYFDIQFVKSQWIAFFYEDAASMVTDEEIKKMGAK